MRIVTHTCPACGTVVAANALYDARVMDCPGLGCQELLRFVDIPEDDRDYFLEHSDRYQI